MKKKKTPEMTSMFTDALIKKEEIKINFYRIL